MRRRTAAAILGLGSALLTIVRPAAADEVRVAVASNFAPAAIDIGKSFEATTGHTVRFAFASTGKHFAQISNGAPFDALLAADSWRPRLLEEMGAAVPKSRFTYARGRLVLWSPRPGLIDEGGAVLAGGEFRFLAIANPKLAPYGNAAMQVLQARGVWHKLERRIVRGENVAQALQYVDSGNADLGFVALSQLSPARRSAGSWWEVPNDLYRPIEQQAVLLREGEAPREFLEFLGSPRGLELILAAGYEVP